MSTDLKALRQLITGGVFLPGDDGRGDDPSTDDAVKSWVKALGAQLRPHEVSTYMNGESDDAARLKIAFSDTRMDKLKKIKQSWDPDNVFRHCANIKP